MKRKSFLISILILCLLSGCGKKSSTAEAEGINGNTVEVGNASTADGAQAEESSDSEWAKKAMALAPESSSLLRVTKYGETGAIENVREYTCNSDGRPVKEITYNADGSVSESDSIFTYEYINGHLVAKNEYDYTGVLLYRYKYDSDGNEFKWILYDSNGEVRMWYINSFDDQGNITGHTLYEPGKDPKVMNLREYDYDENGNISSCRFVTESGTVLNTYAYKYSCDDYGRVTDYEQDDLGASILVEHYRYYYDGSGRLSSQEQLDGDNRVTIRNEYKYDETTGKLVREYIYSSNQQLTVTLEYTWR